MLIHLSSLTPSRLDARISRSIGLSAADGAALKGELAVFAADYKQWQAKAGAQPSEQDEAAAKTMVLASRAAILNLLTPDGAKQLVRYVETEKRRMVVNP